MSGGCRTQRPDREHGTECRRGDPESGDCNDETAKDDRSLAVGPDHDLIGWCALCGRRHDRFRFAGMSQKTVSYEPGEQLLSFFCAIVFREEHASGPGAACPAVHRCGTAPVPEGKERTQKNKPKGQGEYGKGSVTG